MFDFKKNRSKILTIATVVVSCVSLILSALALNNSKRCGHPESFECAKGEHHGKKDCMNRPKDARAHDFNKKGASEEDHKKPENPQKNENHEKPNCNEGSGCDKHESHNRNEKSEKPQENEKPKA